MSRSRFNNRRGMSVLVQIATTIDERDIDTLDDLMRIVPVDGILIHRMQVRDYDFIDRCERRAYRQRGPQRDDEACVPFLVIPVQPGDDQSNHRCTYTITELTSDALRIKLKNPSEENPVTIYYSTLEALSNISDALSTWTRTSALEAGSVKFSHIRVEDELRDSEHNPD